MRRTIYLNAGKKRGADGGRQAAIPFPTRPQTPVTDPKHARTAPAPATPPRTRFANQLRSWVSRHRSLALLASGFALAFLASFLYDLLRTDPVMITPGDVDLAVDKSIEEFASRPAATTAAYASVAPSVVRVRRMAADPLDETEIGVGTGVVIQQSGEILTNLHVVAGAERINVVFANGFETSAEVTGAQPENDLAVLTPEVIPEGLPPATLGSTADLRPGDPVVAVGHPFGIGPSASAGIVSGLRRSYTSFDGSALLDNLIQFDAAANPGNSGGPLVNRRGEVVGIVTSILNPTEDSVFVGIGFAVPIETAANAAGPNPF